MALLLCYDGSEDARGAIARAPALLAGRDAVLLVAWQPAASLPTFAWAGLGPVPDFGEVDRAAAEAARRLADEGAARAADAGLRAEPAVVEARGPVWQTIVEEAERRDVEAIVTGSRGLTGLRSMLLGSVSEGVVRHARRTVVVVRGGPSAGT